jgi:hypothetical protein
VFVYKRLTESRDLDIDLSLVAPLWQLQEKVAARTCETSGAAPALYRALTEFFFTVEQLTRVSANFFFPVKMF